MKRAALELACFLAFAVILALAMREGGRQAEVPFAILNDVRMGYGGLYVKQPDGTFRYMTNSQIRWEYARKP